MKKATLNIIVASLATILFTTSVWAAPTSGPYITDPQNEYVQDATSDSIGTVNMILCIANALNINGSGQINGAAYIALVDINKCDSSHKSSSSSSGASGASASTNYMTAIVKASRASTSAPMIGYIWMSMTEDGKKKDISLRLSASQSPTDVPPYGVFRLDYIGKDSGGTTQFNGFIDSKSGNLQYYETGTNSSNTAMSLTPGTDGNSGSGTIKTGTSTVTTFDFNYNSTNFRRNDGTNDHCFDRLKTNASKSVWRYGTYDNSNGNRVDQTNPGFPVTATTASPLTSGSYYGYASYYGLGFQGLDLNAITDASPISGLTVTDQRPGNSTTYKVSKVGGKLTKWSSHAKSLSEMSGIPFMFYGDMTGKVTGDTTNVTGWGQWQMQWNNTTGTAGNFTVIGKQTCGSSSCAIKNISTTTTVNSGAFNGLPISGWSDAFGGSIDIPPSVGTDHINTEPVNYYSQSIVVPGSTALTLYCLSNCPDATSVAAANANTVSVPFSTATAQQWGYALNSTTGGTVTYSFDAGGLKNGTTAMIINTAAFYTSNPNYQWGVQSGRLFDVAFSSCTAPGSGAAAVCEPANPATYYTWSTGLGQWNQSLWLTKTSDSSVVAFDPPQNIAYTVPSGSAYGTWANKTIQLQFNGFGNLNGIPGYCINPINNNVADCSTTTNARYVPLFSIPDAATMTFGSTTLIVKALDAELRLKDLGVGGTVCPSLTLTTLTPPSTGVHDMTSTSDAYYIGTKPTVSGGPKVIDGIVQ